MSSPKVIEVVGSLAIGGAERVAVEVAAGVQRHGFSTEVVCAGAVSEPQTAYEKSLRAEVESRGVPVSYVVFPTFFDHDARRRLRAHLEARGADLVHVHNRPQDWQTVAVCRLAGIPVLYSVHLTYTPGTWKQQALYVACGRSVPKVVCVSKAVARYAADWEKIPEEKLEVIYNGIQMDRFQPVSAEARAKKRAEMGWSDDEIVFFGAARLSDQKAHHFLIEGFAGLPRTTRARLALAGEGPKRPDLEALIARLGAGDRVTLLGARRDIPELLGGADVYATSSLQEGHPLSILEAMAVNLPVVAPRLPTIEEIALDGTPLFYGPPKSGSPESHDPKDITPVLAQAIERIDELRDKAEKARATVARLYSLEAMNDKHAALYQAILRGGPSRWASRLGGRLFV